MSKPYEYNWQRIKPYNTYRFGKYLLRPITRLLFKVKVHGRENLPKSARGVILACNHLNAIDPSFLVAATMLPWRFIGKKELFQSPLTGFLYSRFGGFPVDRDIIDRRALEYAIAVMEDGRCGLGIFPEGQRSPDGRPQPAKAGVAMLARKARADILPCSLYWEGKLKLRQKVTVRIGELIPFEQLDMGDRPNKRESLAATEKIMATITALWEQGHGLK